MTFTLMSKEEGPGTYMCTNTWTPHTQGGGWGGRERECAGEHLFKIPAFRASSGCPGPTTLPQILCDSLLVSDTPGTTQVRQLSLPSPDWTSVWL